MSNQSQSELHAQSRPGVGPSSLPADHPVAPAPAGAPESFLSFTLHAHLPFVVNHGMWPHGLEWLLEAAAETYLPLLRMFGRLERDGIALYCNLDLTPILLEQLAHPAFKSEFPNYLDRKVNAAREDEAFFLQSGDHHLAETARFWQRFYADAASDFLAMDSDLIRAFRHFNDAGLINIITSAATHGFLPLLGTDESVRAQIALAVETHTRHLGVAPKGVWLPECGYRPASHWEYPDTQSDAFPKPDGFTRPGIEDILAEFHLQYFFVDTPLLHRSSRHAQPGIYHPHLTGQSASPVAVFARDPRSALQVWAADGAYPGDFDYLDFHKKRFPGGHRYWRVTGANLDIAGKQPYYPEAAASRVRVHAAHFASLVRETLASSANPRNPPILNALFDAELFGHWWFEGVAWLEAVARELHAQPSGPALIDCERYLALNTPRSTVSLHEGSWGAGGSSQVWLNQETSWTYARLYPAQLYLRQIVTEGKWQTCQLGTRILQQLCRELLLLESSDWQFLITTGTARDYAESRFAAHHDCFNDLRAMYTHWQAEGAIPPDAKLRLATIETRDSIFPDLDPSLWASKHASAAHASPAVNPDLSSFAERGGSAVVLPELSS